MKYDYLDYLYDNKGTSYCNWYAYIVWKYLF